MPASRRSRVPEFAQSIGSAGASSPPRPRPSIRTRSTSSSTASTPSARTAASVASVSRERPKPRTMVSPSPTAPSRTARCEIDLSPGTPMWPTTARAGSIFTSASRVRGRRTPPGEALTDLFAEQAGDGRDLLGDRCDLLRAELLRPVAERLLGPRMHLDEHTVGTHRRAGSRERGHEVTPSRGVRRIDDHRQVRLALEQGDRAEIERVAGARLERLDPTLAEHAALVPLLRHALRRQEQLVHGRARPALDQHRPVDAAHLGEQARVVHVAGADLDHVRGLGDLLEVAGIEQLAHDRKTGLLARLTQDREPLGAQTLKRVGRGPRLVRTAAQHRRAGLRYRVRRLERLLERLDRARAGDEAEVGAADAPAARLDHRRLEPGDPGDEREGILQELTRGGHRAPVYVAGIIARCASSRAFLPPATRRSATTAAAFASTSPPRNRATPSSASSTCT